MLGIYQGVTKQALGVSFLGEHAEVLVQQLAGRTQLHRSAGTICHPNPYAMYLSAMMSFALALLFSRAKVLYKACGGVVLCIGALGLAFSLSRGGWIGFLAAGLLTLGVALRGRRLKIRTAILIGVMAIISLALVSTSTDLLRTRLTTGDQGAALSRIVLVKGALDIIQDHPLMGVGVNNYSLVMPQYDRASVRAWHSTAIVHTLPLLVAAETGLIGLGAFLWFFASMWARAWRAAKRAMDETLWIASVGAFAAIVVLFLHSLVDYALVACLPLFVQLWLVAGLTAGLGSVRGATSRAADAR
jgi:O-antigen ligase